METRIHLFKLGLIPEGDAGCGVSVFGASAQRV